MKKEKRFDKPFKTSYQKSKERFALEELEKESEKGTVVLDTKDSKKK